MPGAFPIFAAVFILQLVFSGLSPCIFLAAQKSGSESGRFSSFRLAEHVKSDIHTFYPAFFRYTRHLFPQFWHTASLCVFDLMLLLVSSGMISMRPAVQIASSIHKAHPRQPRLFSVTWVTAWTMTWLPSQRGHFIYLSPSRTLVYRHNHIRFYMNMQGNIAARQDSAIDRTGKMIINKRFALSLRIPTGKRPLSDGHRHALKRSRRVLKKTLHFPRSLAII